MNIVIDIETAAPSGALLDYARTRYAADCTAPSNWKDPAKIAEKEAALLADKLAALPLRSAFAEVLCIAVQADTDRGPILFAAWDNDERRTLHLFANYVAMLPPVRWCGHNIRNFDLPILRTRLLSYGLTDAANALRFRRYDVERVADTTEDHWFPCPQGSRWRLADLCAVLGVDAPWGSGADVAKWWADGEVDKIGHHCLSDVRAEYAVCRKLGVW